MDTGDWSYEQVTVNVAFFSGEPVGTVFLQQKPARELRMLSNLW